MWEYMALMHSECNNDMSLKMVFGFLEREKCFSIGTKGQTMCWRENLR